jgi:predicted enzyme related to lactoylglutathione lyase
MNRFFAAAALAGALHAGVASPAPRMPPVTDPPTTISIPGKFIWFDLITPDPLAAQAFYGQVFGWSFQPVAGVSDYTVIAADGRLVGGVFQPVAGAGSPVGTRWLGFVSVRDLRKTISRLGGMGFTTVLPATEVPGRGTQAVVRDPQGAIVGLLKSASGDPRDEPVGPGEFFWVDLYARDVVTASAAYAAIGYNVVPADEDLGDRMLLEASGYARAGITQLPPEGRQPGWLPYVQVEDVAATVATATSAGGKVLMPPDPAVLEGNVAVIGDPLGGVIGVIHWTPEGGQEVNP